MTLASAFAARALAPLLDLPAERPEALQAAGELRLEAAVGRPAGRSPASASGRHSDETLVRVSLGVESSTFGVLCEFQDVTNLCPSFVCRERGCCLQDVWWNPIREGGRFPTMAAASCMYLTHGGEARHVELIGQADQRWPETPMNIGDLAIEQTAGKDLWRRPKKACYSEDVVTCGVRPPPASYLLAGDKLGHIGNRTMRGLEQHSTLAEELEHFGVTHRGLRRLPVGVLRCCCRRLMHTRISGATRCEALGCVRSIRRVRPPVLHRPLLQGARPGGTTSWGRDNPPRTRL